MNASQVHRGPDDEGFAFDDEQQVALAMRRLSIVDIAGGHQPMTDASGRYTIVFNGEVFNAPDLRRDLESRGARLRSQSSDTEVVLELFARHGEQTLGMLNGMFGFAVYDHRDKVLCLARDRLGIKPLYWTRAGSTFAFASELKSLLSVPSVSKELNLQSVHHYLTFQFVPGPASIFAGVNKLQAGHFLRYEVSRAKIGISRYWQPSVALAAPRGRSYQDTVRDLRSLLERVSLEWTMSDVPVGCSLSGGIDSSALVGLLSTQGVGDLHTWTLGFEDGGEGAALDERSLARLVAQKWGTTHHEIVIRADSILQDLDAMVWHLDEPYGGGLPSWYVFREMSKKVKVAMVGTGGDELFGNYGKWRVLETGTLPWLKQLVWRIQTHGLGEVLRNRHGALYSSYFGEKEKRAIWANRTNAFESSARKVEQLWHHAGTRDRKQAVAFVDLQMQLPEEFLHMTDRFSMAWSVEARPPLLDHRLVEFALGLPSSIRSRSPVLKQTLIDAVSDLLPPELQRAKKSGFVLPVAAWLRSELLPLLHEYFSPSFLRQQGLFRVDLFEQLIRPHLSHRVDNSSRIWTVLMFQLWWNKNLGAAAMWRT